MSREIANRNEKIYHIQSLSATVFSRKWHSNASAQRRAMAKHLRVCFANSINVRQ
jgi:hypothetical protein